MPTSVISVDQLDLNNTIQPNTTDTSNYFADNGIIRADFIQTGNTVKYTSKGRTITWVPQNMRYIDSLGMEDSIYSVQDVPLETKANYARFNRTMPDIDDWFIVENDQVKHQILVQGFQRDPMPYLTDPINFAIGGQLIFDADLTVRSMGMTLTGAFQTGDAIQLCDGDEVIFTLPQVVAYDSKIPDRAQTTGFYNVTTNEAGNLQFDIVLDNAWVSDVARVYPLVIDPTVIVPSAYDTSGNGGRRIVRLSNNWIVAAVPNATSSPQINYYVSKDNGTTWSLLTQTGTWAYSWGSMAIASSGTIVYSVVTFTNNTQNYWWAFDATTVGTSLSTWATLDTGQNSFGAGTSLAFDGSGNLLATWCSKNSSYQTAFNIRYSKGTVSGTTVTWATPTQVTMQNSYSGYNFTNPCIVVNSSNNPIIVCQTNGIYLSGGSLASGANYASIVLLKPGTNNNSNIASGWMYSNVYTSNSYNQFNPCAAIDNNDAIDVVWSGITSTSGGYAHVLYSKSSDAGSTWTSALDLTSSVDGSSYFSQYPSLTIDQNNNLYVFFYGSISAYPSANNIFKCTFNGSWTSKTAVTTGTATNDQQPQTLWSKFNMNSSDAVRYMWEDQSGNSVKYDSITLNSPPNAPTLTAHANFDATVAQTLAWTFSDPDSGNTQSAYELQIVDTSNNSVVVDTGKVGSTSSSYTLPANTLAQGKNYQWRVQTWDQSGAQGPYSGYSTFKTSAAPVATVTAPASGATVTSDSYTFTGGYTQPNGVTEQSFQFKLWNQAGTTVVQDSGTIVGTSNAKTFTGLPNNTSYQVEFLVTSQDGVTASSGKVPFSVAYTPPATPTVTTQNNTSDASVTVTFANPTPSGSQPTVSSNNVYRRKVGDTAWRLLQQGATSPFKDYTCPLGAYEYGVTGISSAGAVSGYGTSQVTTSFDGEWVVDESNPANNVVFLYNQRESDATVNQSYNAVQTFAKYPRIRKGQARYRTGNLTALKLSQDGDVISQVDAIDNMCNSDNTYLLKSVNGRIYRVSLSQFKYTGKYGNSIADCSVQWTEVGDV